MPDDRFERGGFPQNIKYTRYSLDRQRIGYPGSLDWHPSDRQTFFLRGVYSKFVEDESGPAIAWISSPPRSSSTPTA